MQLFRDMTQPESGDLRALPGYDQLSENQRTSVHETYRTVYEANQRLGVRVATGVAFAAAKTALTEISRADLAREYDALEKAQPKRTKDALIRDLQRGAKAAATKPAASAAKREKRQAYSKYKRGISLAKDQQEVLASHGYQLHSKKAPDQGTKPFADADIYHHQNGYVAHHNGSGVQISFQNVPMFGRTASARTLDQRLQGIHTSR